MRTRFSEVFAWRRAIHISSAAVLVAGLAVVTTSSAWAADDTIILAQSGDQDRDRDRDRDRLWTDADRDRIRDRLRDGTCEQVAEATDEVLGVVRPCLERDRLRDGSCMDRIGLGLEALQRTRELCRGD